MAHIDYKRIPKVPELRKRLIFTVAMLAVYRVGVYISIPGMNRDAMKAYLGSQDTGVGGFLNMFNFLAGLLEQSPSSPGDHALHHLSIILQVAGVLVPSWNV